MAENTLNDFENEPLKNFVKTNFNLIKTNEKDYSFDGKNVIKLHKDVKNHYYNKLKKETDDKNAKKKAELKALRDIPNALRFLSFTLADFSNHTEAKKYAYWNNYFRTKLWRAEGKWGKWSGGWLFGFTTGYLEKPLRLLRSVILVWILFTLAYFLTTHVTRYRTLDNTYTSITFTSSKFPNASIHLFHYAYFSAVTMTTLGYGDLSTSHNDSHIVANIIMVVLCSIEAILGYVILGICVAMLFRRLEAHPYANMGVWVDKYKQNFELKD